MLIIGIAGGSGSGKTTVLSKIIKNIPKEKISIIPQDSYYKDSSALPLEERLKINFDHPDAIEFELLTEHIKMLKEGEFINQPVYSYLTCERSKETVFVKSTNVVIVEGILIFTNSELRKLMDIKVFVDADADDRLMRIIDRDIVERGRSIDTVIKRYKKLVKPMYQKFIEPSKREADIIVPIGGHNEVAINILTSIIEINL